MSVHIPAARVPTIWGFFVAHSSMFVLIVLVRLHLNNFWGDLINVSFPLNPKSCMWHLLGAEYGLRKHLLNRCQSHRCSSFYVIPKTPGLQPLQHRTSHWPTAPPAVLVGSHAPRAPREPGLCFSRFQHALGAAPGWPGIQGFLLATEGLQGERDMGNMRTGG